MGLNEYIAKQFADPEGLGGLVVMKVMNRQNAAMYDATEVLLQPRDGETILDVGCGNGVMLGRLVRACDCCLIGTDISEDVLKSAKRALGDAGAKLIRCSVDDMPIESASVDKAFTINTVYFWDDLAKGFAEIARVLKPGGLFVGTHYTNAALEAYPHTQFGYKKYTEQEILAAASGAGFEAKVTSIMNGRAYCFVAIRKMLQSPESCSA